MNTLVQSPQPAPSRKAAASSIRTVLTHVRVGADDAPRLAAAVALARKLDATLYGLGVEMTPPLGAMDPTGGLQGEWFSAMRTQTEQNLEQARAAFQAAAQGLKTVWASAEAMPAEALILAARGADLILAGGAPLHGANEYQRAGPAELMLSSGRPVLVAPPSGAPLRCAAVVVAWKDSRESRRALADSLAFLALADNVLVTEVCPASEKDDAQVRVEDVVAGLKRHDIPAHGRVVLAPPERVAAELNVAAEAIGADLIVAGGYGHTRLGEWVFGGVTRDLLHYPERYVLLSH